MVKLYKKENIKEIAEELKNGKIIAFPTDTVFGLACIYDNEDAVNHVFKAKGRSFEKALPMMCNGLKMLEEVAYMNDNAKKVIDAFTPGALTVVLKKKDVISDFITRNQNTVAIRIPDDKWILDLISLINKPILVTSANLSDSGSLLYWKDVYRDMHDRIDGLVTDDASGSVSSTIVLLTDDIKILREGPISLDDIKGVL